MLTVNTFNIYSVQYVGSRRKLTLIGVTFIEGGLHTTCLACDWMLQVSTNLRQIERLFELHDVC